MFRHLGEMPGADRENEDMAPTAAEMLSDPSFKVNAKARIVR
jgi:hypothetical protein